MFLPHSEVGRYNNSLAQTSVSPHLGLDRGDMGAWMRMVSGESDRGLRWSRAVGVRSDAASLVVGTVSSFITVYYGC